MTEERLDHIEALIVALSDNVSSFRSSVADRFDRFETKFEQFEGKDYLIIINFFKLLCH